MTLAPRDPSSPLDRLAALALLAGVAVCVVMVPGYLYFSGLSQQADENRRLERQITRLEQASGTRRAAPPPADRSAEIAALVIPHGDRSRAGADLQDRLRVLVEDSGAGLDQMTLLGGGADAGLVTVRLQLTAQELDLYALLGRLEDSLPPLSLDRMDLTGLRAGQGDEGPSPVLRVTLDVSAAHRALEDGEGEP